MGYRVYDNKAKKWVQDNVYLRPDDELFLIKQSLFGMVKIPMVLSYDRYIFHRDIELYDKMGVLIYEGDYIKAKVSENKEVVGVVVYAKELSAYIILCEEYDEYYTLGTETCQYIEIVGNVFDGYTTVVDNDFDDFYIIDDYEE